MLYKVIGTMSGSSMDGLDIVYVHIEEIGGAWSFEIKEAACMPFDTDWKLRLQNITNISAKELLLTHTAFGKWMGEQIQTFIVEKNLEHKIDFIASHGHTVFHEPQLGMTFQMGDGAAIVAQTHLPVITDLRNMDVAFGGQGAPIVPIAEKYLWKGFDYFLNLGGIANISIHANDKVIAYDICVANRVLNLLANELGKEYDKEGEETQKGNINNDLLNELNNHEYFKTPAPKSLANEFGTDVMIAIISKYNISVQDKLRTFTEHICIQIANCEFGIKNNEQEHSTLLITGGGAYNKFLIDVLIQKLKAINLEVVIPDVLTTEYKEAVAMALIGVLRWRDEVNVLHTVTGATQSSVGGALWMSS
jgi:anhydro-N-acetylmuramic acid kinase